MSVTKTALASGNNRITRDSLMRESANPFKYTTPSPIRTKTPAK